MKKIIPLFLACGLLVSLPFASKGEETNVANASSDLVSTYLVLTENGLYNGEVGQDYSELFLENTIKYEAEAGSELPGKDVVTNTVKGVTFNGWINYTGEGVPTGYVTVPNKDNTILYASWVHDGSSTPDIPGGGDDEENTMRVYFKAPDGFGDANIYYWSSSENPVEWPGVKMNLDSELNLWYYDYDTTRYPNVIFNNGTDQTKDLASPTDSNSDCYVWENGWYNEDTEEVPPVIDATQFDYYLVPNDWRTANAWFSAWVWGASEGTWVELTKIDSNLYGFNVPEGTTNLIFVRNNPSNTTLSWDDVWNQTADLALPTNGANCYTITGWEPTDGSWSTR